MREVFQRIAELTQLEPETIRGLIVTVLILVVIILIRLLAVRLVRQNIDEIKRQYRWRRAINYIAGLIAVLLIGRVWLPGLEGLGVVLGLASAGIAIALRDPIVCIVGWLFILIRRPYIVGDRIEVRGQMGDVIDVRMFQTFMVECKEWVDGDQSTGRIITIPNNFIFTDSVANFTHGFEYIWDELFVRLTFESDWKRAKEILTEIINNQMGRFSDDARRQIHNVAGEHMILYQKLTPIVYTAVKEWGVQLSVRYLTPPRQRRGSAQKVWEEVLEAFSKEPSIRFAYPTTRFFHGPESTATARD